MLVELLVCLWVVCVFAFAIGCYFAPRRDDLDPPPEWWDDRPVKKAPGKWQ